MAESHGTVNNSEPVKDHLSEKYAGKSWKFLKKSFFYLKRTMPMEEEIKFV